MTNIRRGENKRESWWATNKSKKTVAIGDLLLVPAIKPGKKIDLLNYYTREKISHSTVLVSLIKSGIISLSKDKIYTNDFPGSVSPSNIDEAITSAEENEVYYFSHHSNLSNLKWSDSGHTIDTGVVVQTKRITSTTTLNETYEIIYCDTDGGGFTVNLPTGIDGTHYKIINSGSSGNDVTLAPDGTEKLFGDAAPFIILDSEIIDIHYNLIEGWW